jgi:signal peptidase II
VSGVPRSAPGLSGRLDPRRRPVVFAVAAAILSADQATKFWAESDLTGHAPIPLIGDFLGLRLLYNSGAAFSVGSGSTWVLTLLAAGAVIALVRLATRVRSLGWAIGVGLLLGGASTHLLDRLVRSPGFGRGHVVDFIDYNGWFVGNVADIALVAGAGLLVLQSILGRELDGRPDPRPRRLPLDRG